MLPKYGLVLPNKNENQLAAKRSRRTSGGLCDRHMLIRKYNRPVCFAIQTFPIESIICCTTVCLDGIGSMRFFILRYSGELVTYFLCLWNGRWPRAFWGISNEECCFALVYSLFSKPETAIRLKTYCSC